MTLFRRLRQSPASRTAAASYLAFASTAIWGLVIIPIAVAFLSKTELGLWTVVNAFLQYLVWFDLGIGPATGRMMADSVAARDQIEINRWWTTTRAILFMQGIVIILLGLALMPLFLRMLAIPSALSTDARWLLIGGILITGLSLPMRGAPGLLTAQNRFYWVPIVQAVTPWINLLVFYLLLRKGLGLKSYIWAMAASQTITWAAYSTLIIIGPDRPRLDLAGFSKPRFSKLFKYSGNMTIVGIADVFFKSLPTFLIARLGGLTMVPLFNFSWKGPLLASGLVQRTYQSFYPNLQRLHVTGNHEEFKLKHHLIGSLTLGIALCAAALVLACNTLIVQFLAGMEFYAGPAATVGFALAMITIPMSGFFRILLPISGDLGKLSFISALQIGAMIIAILLAWKPFGLAGVAFIFALNHLCQGIYGFTRGARNCGYNPCEISRNVAIQSLAAMLLVSLCGLGAALLPQQGTMHFEILGRGIAAPPLSTLAVALIPLLPGLILLTRAGRSILHKR